MNWTCLVLGHKWFITGMWRDIAVWQCNRCKKGW